MVLESMSPASSELTAHFPLMHNTDSHLGSCYGLNYFLPSDSHVGVLICYVMVLEDRAFVEIIRVR